MRDNILPHHRETIERATEHFRADPANRAMLIGGSICKGLERPDSDVDVMLIVSEEEYQRREANREATFFTKELATYEGGYVDGKYMSERFLLQAAEKGSEPTRWSFVNSIIAFSDIHDIHTLLNRVTQYPIHEQAAKIRSFYGQLFITHWYIGEAEKRNNAYLMTRMAADLVLYSCRLLLAHNQMLYPFHKWMMTEVRRMPDMPSEFLSLIDTMLAAPNKDNAKALFDCVTGFRDWGVSVPDAVNAFAEDSERYWLWGRPALSDW
jgi:predicted nucleotidyltransferase